MQHHFRNGGAARLSAPSLKNALSKALKQIIKTLDGRYVLIETSTPQLVQGKGLAAALDSLATAKNTPARIQSAVERIEAEVNAEIALARGLVQQADRHTALLKSLAAHILTGAAIRFAECDPRLAENAMLLRNAMLLGDPGGSAKSTAAILNQQADIAAANVATCADDILRKMTAAIRTGMNRNAASVYERALASSRSKLAIIDDTGRTRLDRLSRKAETKWAALRDAYGKVYLDHGTGYRRFPNLQCVDKFHLKKLAFGYEVLP